MEFDTRLNLTAELNPNIIFLYYVRHPYLLQQLLLLFFSKNPK